MIEYSANTRGYFQKITIQNQTVTVSKERQGNDNPKPEKISDAAWKALITEFQAVNIEDLPNLKAPTEKRFYDGAAIGNLKITYRGKTYETTGFDHGIPPAEIEGLVSKMQALVKE